MKSSMLSLRLRSETQLHSPHTEPIFTTNRSDYKIFKQVHDYIKQIDHTNCKHITCIIFIIFIVQCIDFQQPIIFYIFINHHTTLHKQTTLHHNYWHYFYRCYFNMFVDSNHQKALLCLLFSFTKMLFQYVFCMLMLAIFEFVATN